MSNTLTSDEPSEASPLLRDPESNDRDHEDGQVSDNGAPTRMYSDRKMHLILASVGIGVYLAAADQLITVASYAKIGSELHALNNTSWIATAYFLTLTSGQPLYGKLSDIFGRKPCLLFAYTVFAIGCLGCGLAQSMAQLCTARAIAGIGGGGMNSVVAILLSDLVPLKERGVWQGKLSILFFAGTATGAPLGGLMADSVGWRWSFLGQVPLCFVAFVAVYFVLDLPPVEHDHWLSKIRKVDFFGALTLVMAVVALLVGLDSGSNRGWSHSITIIALSLTPGLFGLFVLVELKVASHPLAPGHIIFDRSLFACYLVNFASNAGNTSVIFFLPLFFQAVQGLNAAQSGALLVPVMLFMVVSSILSGSVIKRTEKFYTLNLLGYALAFVSIVPICLFVWYRSTLWTSIALVVMAVGTGNSYSTTLIGLLANATVDDTAVVVASAYLFRALGSSIGVSTGSAVLQQVLRTELVARLPDQDKAREIEERVRQSLEYIKQLPPNIAEQVKWAYQVATIWTMASSSVYFLIAFIFGFWVKEKSLKR
ncbi:major facilitator superfamily domain-containing protein [Fusarium flagelliforme]|uniref:Multidrug resistance protein n=1 Tax=Fusarium flagelliforme TaxID=2675880 RepID=A0A395MFR9_9HYPO|nr:major facilitator superfamily domain-containing protein [Fusarium flagelliforme]KAH7188729.1 major facilitator superfamily domain-containing protein [Fusarium flagelliforme]RFN46734.1 multidrug resistance protein [Fusarium flagelliforme]